jgi:hypothetical protein
LVRKGDGEFWHQIAGGRRRQFSSKPFRPVQIGEVQEDSDEIAFFRRGMSQVQRSRIEHNMDLRRCGGLDNLDSIEHLRHCRWRKQQSAKRKHSAQHGSQHNMAHRTAAAYSQCLTSESMAMVERSWI